MEQRTKLAAVCLGICFIFTAFPWVSSMRVYDPNKIIDGITALLEHLEKDLERLANKLDHFTVKGPSTKTWEDYKNCTGSFLDIFTNGTEAISVKLSDNRVANISKRIRNCVEHLEDTDCTKLKDSHNKTCEEKVESKTVTFFVKQFLGFSKAFRHRGICGQSFRQKYDRRQDDWPELIHTC